MRSQTLVASASAAVVALASLTMAQTTDNQTDPFTQLLGEENNEWRAFWSMTVEEVLKEVNDGNFENIPTSQEGIETLLRNSDLGWLLDIRPESFMIDSEEWDRQALQSTMGNLNYFLISQKGIYFDQEVHAAIGMPSFSLMRMDFYLASLDAVIQSIRNLTWVKQAASGEINLKFLDRSQLTDIARILIQQGANISVDELEMYQMLFFNLVVEFNIKTVDDVTEEVACQVLTNYLPDFEPGNFGYVACFQFIPGTFFNIFLDWFTAESDIDLRSLGLNTFDDVTQEILFQIASDKLKEEGIVLYDYQILSFDDFSGDNLAWIMEDSEVAFEDDLVTSVQKNFPVIKMQIQDAAEQANANLVMLHEAVEKNSQDNGAVIASYASLAVALTASLISFAF